MADTRPRAARKRTGGDRPALFVHIGLPKTGSSALQVFFARNVSAFKEHNIIYPWVSNQIADRNTITSGNAAKLARYGFIDNKNCYIEEQKLESILYDSADDILISSEYFSRWNYSRFNRFNNFASKLSYNTKIILYLKDQADIAITHYFQKLKRMPGFIDYKREKSLKFIDNIINKTNFIDFHIFLDGLSRVFGRENIIVRTSRRDRLAGGSLMTDFLDAIGIDDMGGFNLDVPRVNPTPRQHEMYIRALLGAFGPSVKTSDVYLDLVSRLYETEGTRAVDAFNYFIDPDMVRDIRDRFRESNERTCRDWFGGRPASEIFEPRDYPPRVSFSYDTSDLESVIAMLGGLSVNALDRVAELERRLDGRAQGGVKRGIRAARTLVVRSIPEQARMPIKRLLFALGLRKPFD